jgi:hypothetical protein
MSKRACVRGQRVISRCLESVRTNQVVTENYFYSTQVLPPRSSTCFFYLNSRCSSSDFLLLFPILPPLAPILFQVANNLVTEPIDPGENFPHPNSTLVSSSSSPKSIPRHEFHRFLLILHAPGVTQHGGTVDGPNRGSWRWIRATRHSGHLQQ